MQGFYILLFENRRAEFILTPPPPIYLGQRAAATEPNRCRKNVTGARH